jgi:hypothetical protein
MTVKNFFIFVLLIYSLTAAADISFYGRLELNAAYENGNTSGLWTSTVLPQADTMQGRTTLSAARTRLGFNLSDLSKEDKLEASGRFEADFAGSNNFGNFNGSDKLRLRQSYGLVKFKNIGLTFLIGQTDNLMAPYDPPSVNPGSLSNVGNMGGRVPQIRLTQTLGPVDISIAATHDRVRDGEDHRPPASPGVQGRLGLKLPAAWAGEKANIATGITGHFAKEESANQNDKEREDRGPESWSLGLDLSLPIISLLTFTGEFFMGQSLRNYDASLGLHLLSSKYPDDPSYNNIREHGIQSIGGWGAIEIKFPADFSGATGIGMEALDDGSIISVKPVAKPGDDKPKSNMFVFANFGYSFTSTTKLTFEYLRLSSSYPNRIGEEPIGTRKGEPVFALNGPKIDNGNLSRYELNFRYNFK